MSSRQLLRGLFRFFPGFGLALPAAVDPEILLGSTADGSFQGARKLASNFSDWIAAVDLSRVDHRFTADFESGPFLFAELIGEANQIVEIDP